MRGAMAFAVKIVEAALILSAVLMFLFAGPLVQAFIGDGETIGYGMRFLKGFCLAQPFLALDFLCVGVFQAVGMGREALVLAILRKAVFEIPLLYLLNRLAPLFGLPYAQAVTECVMAAAAVGLVVRFLKKENIK